ncbi:MAG: hypothetical protein ABIR78_00215 [Ferruginibacter sp.]
MKKLYQFKWYRYVLLPLLAIISFTPVKSQTVVTADPAFGSFDITDLSDVSINALQLHQNSIYKLKLDFNNLHFTNEIPGGTMYVEIGLGSKFILAPAFDISNAPLNNYFNFQYIPGTQPKIRCYLVNNFPADFFGKFVFQVKANVLGSSTVTGNIYFTNTPNYILNDADPSNNNAFILYSIGAGGPVPVTITSFGARNKNCSIDVNWSVAQESALSRYEVEISKDGSNFVKAATVTAQNKASYAASFAITDDFRSATLFVRLKSIDLDGSYKYTQIVVVSGSCSKSQQEIYCYPNPLTREDHITIASRGDLFNGTYQVLILDAAGKNYGSGKVVVSNVVSFNYAFGHKLAAGNYFIVLRRGDGTTAATLPFVKY